MQLGKCGVMETKKRKKRAAVLNDTKGSNKIKVPGKTLFNAFPRTKEMQNSIPVSLFSVLISLIKGNQVRLTHS